MTMTPVADKIPYVGVGCIVVRDGQLLLVRNHRGFWSTPGGHLDFGESPEVCAARETLEETGISVTKVEFVAITNDVLEDAGKHYVTIWMRAEGDDIPPVCGGRVARAFAALLQEPHRWPVSAQNACKPAFRYHPQGMPMPEAFSGHSMNDGAPIPVSGDKYSHTPSYPGEI